MAHAPARAAGQRSLMHELHVFVAFPGTAARRRPRPGRGQRGSRKKANRVLLVHQRGFREGLRWCSCRTWLLIFTGTAAGSPDWPGRGQQGTRQKASHGWLVPQRRLREGIRWCTSCSGQRLSQALSQGGNTGQASSVNRRILQTASHDYKSDQMRKSKNQESPNI